MPVALLTGISGQTGSYTAELLRAHGWTVHGVVRELEELAHDALSHQVDLEDADALRELVVEIRPDAVINLAALSSVWRSWQEPLATARINALAVAALLDGLAEVASQADSAPVFVQASSSEIFGAAEHAPQDEGFPLRPINPYGASKAYGHMLTAVYRAKGIAASNVVLYNHESPRRPETFVTRKITAAAARIARGQQSVLSLGDLDIRRDWGWAPDYADAIVRIAEAGVADDFVVATGESHSIREFVERAFARAGITDWERHVESDSSLIRPADAPDMRGDATHLRDSLGWRPTKSFAEIVDAMVDHDLAATES